MPLFIKGRIAVTAEGVIDERDITPEMNIVFIYPKMPYGVKQEVLGRMMRMSMPVERKTPRGRHAPPAIQNGRSQQQQPHEIEMDFGAYTKELLAANILGWQGPDLYDVPLTRENIFCINDEDPLWARVLQEIGERNKGLAGEDAEDDDPKSSVIDGAAVLTAKSAAPDTTTSS